MKNFINFCLDNRVASNLFAFFLVVAGLLSAQNINVRFFPELTIKTIRVSVPYPGATPQEVETAIVKPIEERLDGLEGVRKITSLAAPGTASILVQLEEDVSIPKLKDDVQAEIDRITVFPRRAERPVVSHVKPDELSSRIILYGDVDRETLKRAAERVRVELADRDHISRVATGGIPDYLIDIAISQQSLEALGLSLVDVSNRVAAQSLDMSGGQIEEDSQKVLIRSVGERRTKSAFDTIVLGSSENGTPLLLSDVAEVRDGLSERPIRAVYKGKPAVFVSVSRVGSEQQIKQTEQVRDYFANQIQSALPVGVSAEYWRDETVMLEDRISLLTENAGLGLALVGILLMAFLDIRIAAWVAFGVGVSFIGALTLMQIFGVTINQLTLFGFILAIGIVVDDAIVVGENIHAVRREGKLSAHESARSGVLHVSSPIVFSVTTTILAFVPLLALPGTFGQFLGPIASVVIFVLVLSLFESFFILPRHLAHLSNEAPGRFSPRRVADPFRNWAAEKLRRFSEHVIRPGVVFSIKNPVAIVLLSFGLFFASMSLVTSGVVKFLFFPEVEGDYINVTLELSEATSQDKTEEMVRRIAAVGEEVAYEITPDGSSLRGMFWVLGQDPKLSNASPKTKGGAASNKAFVVARLKDAGSRNFSAHDYVTLWRKKLGDIPGAQTLMITADLISPGRPVYFEVSTRLGEDAKDALRDIRAKLEAYPGVYEVEDNLYRVTDEIRIAIKPLARSYGLTQQSLAMQVRAAFFGAEAVRIQRDREEIEVRVRLPKAERINISAIDRVKIKVGNGFVPLTSLADVDIVPAPATINRVDNRQIYTLSSEVDKAVTTPGAVTDYILQDVVPSLASTYDGLKVSLAGDQEEQAKMAPVISRNFLMAMLAIFSLLALSFKSYTQPIIIMSAIPFGFMGAVLGHAALGKSMTLLSFFGVIGLSGVIINNSLMIVTFINERLAAGHTHDEAVESGVMDRFRAILLTTLTTFLGVFPLILETSVQAQFLVPTAISLGVGIVVGTSILIFLIPALATLHLKIFGRHREA